MNGEVFKDIKGYDGLYQISNYGRVRSLDKYYIDASGRSCFRKGKLMGLANMKGYKRIALFNNIRKSHSVHRLVAEAFIPNPENKPCVNHIDCNKSNNYYKNLEWVTYEENSAHSIKNNLEFFHSGGNHYLASLTNEQANEIRSKYIPYKYSTHKLAKEYNVNQNTIYNIISNKSYKY